MIRIYSNLVSCGSEPPRLAHPQQAHFLYSCLALFSPNIWANKIWWKGQHVTPKVGSLKILWLLLCFSGLLSQVSQLPYHEDMKAAFWRVPMVRNPGLFPTAILADPSALIKPSDVCSLASSLSATTWELLSQNHPAKLPKSWPTDTVWDSKGLPWL